MAMPWEEFQAKTEAAPWEEFQPPVNIQGKPDASAAETERMRREFIAREGAVPTRIKEFARSTFDPTQATPAADSLTDWATRVVPESATKFIPRAAMGIYDVIKGQTDPLVETMFNNNPNKAPARQQMEQNARQTVTGLAQGMAAPVGLMGYDKMEEAWLTDPVMSAAAAYPSLKADAMMAKEVLGKINVTPQGLARSALKPYIGEVVAKNKMIEKALDTAVYDKNASMRPRKFVENNLKEMEEIVGRQNVLLDEKGSVRADITPIRQELESFVNKARETPGRSKGAISAAEAVLDDILNHSDYRADGTMGLEAIQQTKKNIWRDLKEKNAFSKDANPALADAMWSAADGMVKIVNEVIPEMRGENARYGELANVNKVLLKAANRIDNTNLISLPVAIQLMRGDFKSFGQALAIKTIDSPYFKLYLAQKIAKSRGKPATPKELSTVLDEVKTQADFSFNPETLPGRQSSQMDVIPGNVMRDLESGGVPAPMRQIGQATEPPRPPPSDTVMPVPVDIAKQSGLRKASTSADVGGKTTGESLIRKAILEVEQTAPFEQNPLSESGKQRLLGHVDAIARKYNIPSQILRKLSLWQPTRPKPKLPD